MPEDTYSTEGPQCPYCKRQYTADEPCYYDERLYTEETCDNCEKTFSVSVCHSTSWSCEPLDDGEDDSTPLPSQQSREAE